MNVTLTRRHGSHGIQLHRASRDSATYSTRCSCTTIRIKWAYGRNNLLTGERKERKRTDITAKWCKFGQVTREFGERSDASLRRKSWEPHMGWGGGGGHPRDDAAQWEFRPRWASACNWQSSCPVSVHASRKNLANKTPCFEELILLTRIERYFTEKELAAGLIFTLTYILAALASKGISLNASPSWLVGHRVRQCPGTPDKKEE